jgi:hypothetical protein
MPHCSFLSGYFPLSSLLCSQRVVHTIDFLSIEHKELLTFSIPFTFRIEKTGRIKILYALPAPQSPYPPCLHPNHHTLPACTPITIPSLPAPQSSYPPCLHLNHHTLPACTPIRTPRLRHPPNIPFVFKSYV